jgi:4-hydroxy-tetrahydrodipicolinate synthase
MLTPLKEDNTIDYKGLKRLTEFYIEGGADGLFANCLSSEMFQLTDEERLRVTRTVVEAVNGRIPVISTGSFGNDMVMTSIFINKLYETGVDAVVISTSQPCNEIEGDDIFKLKVGQLMNKTGDVPLGLYECPVPYKRLMSPKTLKWLARSGRFLYHKDTSCNLEEIQEKIEAVEGTPLGIYNAHVPTGIASMHYGARGLSPIAANLYPELFSYLLDHFEKEANQEIMKKLSDNLDMMDTIIHHNYPYSAKLFLKKRGFDINTNSRISRKPMTAHDYNKLETVMNVFEQLTGELEIGIVPL